MSLLLDRLRELELEFERRNELRDEMMRYFPVAIIACMEGFFRELIRELIDHGSPFSDRLDSIEISRVDMQALKAIHGRTITVGEFVAHQVPLSSFENINGIMTKLVGDEFLEQLKMVKTNWSRHLFGDDAPTILGEPGPVLAGVKEAFNLRHILAHELATAYPITRDQIETTFSSAAAFIYAANELVQQLIDPDEPVSQSGMTQAAWRRYEEARMDLEGTERQIRQSLPNDKVQAFDDAQAAWSTAREATARLHADLIAAGGSMWPQMYNGMLGAMTRHRAEELRFLGGGFSPTT